MSSDIPTNTMPAGAPAAPSTFTTPEEERMIDDAFREVLDGYLQSNHRKKVEIRSAR